ncbi:MAG: transposase [Bacteroidota bacterium]
MDLNQLYFYTVAIYKWQYLLLNVQYKKIILSSLQHLVNQNKLKVYAFVIMPNHIHFIWELKSRNGKESVNASFMKYTAHQFQEELRKHPPYMLERYRVNRASRKYNFWQSDAYAFHLYKPKTIQQKLDYLHGNPCQGRWMLVDDPIEYPYSSLRFYETGVDQFGFLSHIGEYL